ncbi:YceI family protein [Flavobacterium flavipallidum]|uniref:YceI family protein n=1 Tax=Flavobacterium flavipallidum TaxID=3139140 RepID=A0ABU9HMA8_9FLAO
MKTKWIVNSNQSEALIRIKDSIIAYLSGNINNFQGYADFNNGEIENATIAFSLDFKNRESKLERLGNYLKLNNFFDINHFPTISFKSTSFQKANKNIHFLKGDLTIKNITKSVELDVELIENDYLDTKKKRAVELTANINRNDFELSNNQLRTQSKSTKASNIKIVANVEFNI